MKYYKPNHEVEITDEHRMRRKRLYNDRRVKSMRNCRSCGMPISEKEYKRHRGFCKKCSNENSTG